MPVLTSLRFFAAAMIFVYHLREFPPYDGLHAIAPGMSHGVSFFFVLSGFVLAYAHSGREWSVRRFYVARLARIWPLHIFCLALVVAALPLRFARGQDLGPAASLATFVLKAFMLDAWAPMRATLSSWNNVSWSISAEMAFYAAFPPLLAAMTRRPALTLAAAFAASLAVLGLGAAAGLPVYVNDSAAATLTNLGNGFPLARGFEFALGIAAFLTWRRWIAPARWPRAVWTALEALTLGGAGVWLVVCVPALVADAQGALFVWLRASSSCGVFALLIVVLASGRGRIGRALAAAPLVRLGQASFAFYLVHVIVLRVLIYYVDVGPAAYSALAFASALGLAFLLHWAVETPMRRWTLALVSRPGGPAAPFAASQKRNIVPARAR